MAPRTFAPLCSISLLVVSLCLSQQERFNFWKLKEIPTEMNRRNDDQKNITAESGQDVTLTCRAPNNNIIVVEWSRCDQKGQYVLLYRDDQFVPDDQHPSFKNRVDLQDRQMKDGDVSLILKNVTINDAGKYECRVVHRRTNRRKRAHLKTDPITSITLRVVPPGQTGGDTEDGSVGLIVGLTVPALLLFTGVVGFLIYRKHKEQQSQDSYQPPVELQPV